MSLFAGKYIAILLALLVLAGFYTGLLHYNHDKIRCLVPRSYTEGSWHTIFAIGRLEFRAKDFTCDPGFKLDPSQWTNESGNLVPKVDSSTQ